MLAIKRAVALMLTAFLLLSALPVSTLASDKAAASCSPNTACFDRLLETAPIDEAASDTGAGNEVETAQEYEKGAGDGTGALFGCDEGAGDETDAIYESETGAGDETGALFGCDEGAEAGGMNEDRDGFTDMSSEEPASEEALNGEVPLENGLAENSMNGEVSPENDVPEDGISENPAAAEEAYDEYGLPEETESGAGQENTTDEVDSFDDLTGEIAGTAFDSGEIPGGLMPADETLEEEQGAEDAGGEEIYVDQPGDEGEDGEEINVDQPGDEGEDGEEINVDQPGAEDADGEEIYADQPGAEDAGLDGTDTDGTDDPALYADENVTGDDASAAEADPDNMGETDAGDQGMSSAPAAGEESPGQAFLEDDSSPEAAGESYESEAVTEDAAAGSTYSEVAAAAPETGDSDDSVPEGQSEALSDQTQTGPDTEAESVSVDERAPLTAMSLSLTDQVVMNIYVRADDSVEADDYIEFSYAGETLQQSVGDADVNRMTLADGETFDVLAFELPLRLRQMTDDVTFRMVVDGEEGTPKTRTVRSYADQILQGNFSDEQKEVTRAMLNCGSCAQEYFGYNTDRPANAGIYEPGEDPARDWEDPDLSSYDYSLHQDSLLGFEFCETTLELQEDISLICYFRVGEGHFFDNFTNWFYDFSLKGSDLDLTPGYDRDKGMYFVRIPHIMPYELDDMFEIEVTSPFSGHSRIIANLKYSPLTYCRDMLASDTSSREIKNLCRSLYYYCNAANIMRNEVSSSVEK